MIVGTSNSKSILRRSNRKYFIKKVFLKISQYSQANTCVRHQHRCFPGNIAKLLKTHILKNIGELLLLYSIFVSPKQTNVEFRNCLKLVSESLMYRNLGGLKDIVSYHQQKFWMRAMVFLVLWNCQKYLPENELENEKPSSMQKMHLNLYGLIFSLLFCIGFGDKFKIQLCR